MGGRVARPRADFHLTPPCSIHSRRTLCELDPKQITQQMKNLLEGETSLKLSQQIINRVLGRHIQRDNKCLLIIRKLNVCIGNLLSDSKNSVP